MNLLSIAQNFFLLVGRRNSAGTEALILGTKKQIVIPPNQSKGLKWRSVYTASLMVEGEAIIPLQVDRNELPIPGAVFALEHLPSPYKELYAELRRNYKNGHYYYDVGEWLNAVSRYKGIPIKEVYTAWESDLFSKLLDLEYTANRRQVVPRVLLQQEKTIVAEVSRLLSGKTCVLNNEKLEKSLQTQFAYLTDEQKQACRTVFQQPFTLITGYPGCGKTTVIRALRELAGQQQWKMKVCAPTAKAALNVDSAGMTVHRLIEVSEDGPRRNASRPLKAKLVVLDESSMMGTELAVQFLQAIQTGAHVVWVGDPNQLSSVQPGQVFKDLLKAGLPQVHLTKVWRQGKGSIIDLCEAVFHAQAPTLGAEMDDQVSFISAPDAEITQQVALLRTEVLPKMGFADNQIRVLAALKEWGDASVMELTKTLRQAVYGFAANRYPILNGEHLMWLHNDYRLGLINGQDVMVRRIAHKGTPYLLQTFDGREIEVGEAHMQTTSALAMTVHKAQGGEAEAVICVLPRNAFGFITRPVIYTAASRAKQKLIFVGDYGAYEKGVTKSKGTFRKTGLAGLMREKLWELNLVKAA